MEITLVKVTVRREYAVAGAELVRDSVGCPIVPEQAAVRFSTARSGELRPNWVAVRGTRTRGKKTIGTYSEGGYSVRDDGSVEPDRRYGAAPDWVTEIVRRAIQEQSSAFRTVTATP